MDTEPNLSKIDNLASPIVLDRYPNELKNNTLPYLDDKKEFQIWQVEDIYFKHMYIAFNINI